MNRQTVVPEGSLHELERLRDALDHIERTCHGSRTQTRRLRFIALRAKCALEDREDWRDADIPRHDPLVERLQGIIAAIYPIAKAELEALVDSYSTLSEHERGHATWEAVLESFTDVLEEADGVKADAITIRQFLRDARHNVPSLNIAELDRGEPWVEL